MLDTKAAQILGSVGLEIDSSHASHLVEKHGILERATYALNNHLIEEVHRVDGKRCRLLQHQREKKTVLASVQDEVKVRSQSVAFLDTTNYELLRVEGDTYFEHKFKLLDRTRNYRFVLSTNYPIRRVEPHITSKHSVWEVNPDEWQLGGYQLDVVLKNNPIRSASAGMALYGWRRETNAHRVREETNKLRQSVTERDQLLAEIEIINKKMERLFSLNKFYTQVVDDCTYDLQKLSRRPCYPNINVITLVEYAIADSVYGIAILLGLKSNVQKSIVQKSSILHTSGLLDTQAPKNMLKGLGYLLTYYSKHVNALHASTKKNSAARRSWETQLKDKTMLAFRQEQDSVRKAESLRLRSKATECALQDDKEHKTLWKEGADIIEQLGGSFTSFREECSSAFNELSTKRKAIPDCCDELLGAKTCVDLDMDSNTGVMAMLASDFISIGALASLRECRSVSAAWAAICRGHRLASAVAHK